MNYAQFDTSYNDNDKDNDNRNTIHNNNPGSPPQLNLFLWMLGLIQQVDGWRTYKVRRVQEGNLIQSIV